jgi:ribosomal protein S21
VELKDLPPNASYQERESAFKKLLNAFRKEVGRAEIMKDYKEHQQYEKPSVKKRRTLRQNEINRLKTKLKENFPEENRSSKTER